MGASSHDGTPHWHILIYCEPKYRTDVSSLIKELALEDSPDDKGADERRCDIKDIDWSIGSGVAYASKYVAKNVDGEHLNKDKDNRDPKESAIRAVAWASIHSIRQFQQFGGPSVTCWRELRKLGNAPEGILEEARTAADQADWETFTQILGGTNTCRKSQKIKIVREFNEEPGKYGEPKGDQIVGISNGYTCIQTRMHTWKRKLKSKSLRVLDAVRHT